MPSDSLPLDTEARAQMKRWLDDWKRIGPILDAARWERLRAMTHDEAQQASRRVLELWRPDWRGDDGEEIVLHQRVFARARQ